MAFPVWSRFISPIGAGKIASDGFVGMAVSCGGVVVRPGDFVVADPDGIVVLPPGHTEDAIRAATEHVELERSLHAGLAEGRVPLDLLRR